MEFLKFVKWQLNPRFQKNFKTNTFSSKNFIRFILHFSENSPTSVIPKVTDIGQIFFAKYESAVRGKRERQKIEGGRASLRELIFHARPGFFGARYELYELPLSDCTGPS